MSYMDAFLLLAILNGACILLVLVTIKKKKAIDKNAPKIVISDH